MKRILCICSMLLIVGCGGNKGSGPPKISTEASGETVNEKPSESKTKGGNKVQSAPINSLSG